MAMATREHKRNFYSSVLTAQNILFLEALANSKPTLEFTQTSNKNTSMSGRSASVSVANDAMVCVECFRMKGDQDLKAPCQNPRCYFYLQVPDDPHTSQRNSLSPGQMFRKKVGCDRSSLISGRAAKPSRPSQSSDYLLSSQANRSSRSSNVWAFRPENKGYMSQPQQSGNQMRSQSISAASSAVIGPNALHKAGISGVEKSKLMRKRMMSMPLVAGMESLMDSSESDLLVEDAFLSSPLPEFTSVAADRALNPGAVGQKMVSCKTEPKATALANHYSAVFLCTPVTVCPLGIYLNIAHNTCMFMANASCICGKLWGGAC